MSQRSEDNHDASGSPTPAKRARKHPHHYIHPIPTNTASLNFGTMTAFPLTEAETAPPLLLDGLRLASHGGSLQLEYPFAPHNASIQPMSAVPGHFYAPSIGNGMLTRLASSAGSRWHAADHDRERASLLSQLTWLSHGQQSELLEVLFPPLPPRILLPGALGTGNAAFASPAELTRPQFESGHSQQLSLFQVVSLLRNDQVAGREWGVRGIELPGLSQSAGLSLPTLLHPSPWQDPAVSHPPTILTSSTVQPPLEGTLPALLTTRSLLDGSSRGPKTEVSVIPVSADSDKECVSKLQALLREQMVFFGATPADIHAPAQGRNKPVRLGQVGIACRHCRGSSRGCRTRGAVYFPQKLSSIYQSAQNMLNNHFSAGNGCPNAPKGVNQRFQEKRSDGNKSIVYGGGQQYWAMTASNAGISETEHGLAFEGDAAESQEPKRS